VPHAGWQVKNGGAQLRARGATVEQTTTYFSAVRMATGPPFISTRWRLLPLCTTMAITEPSGDAIVGDCLVGSAGLTLFDAVTSATLLSFAERAIRAPSGCGETKAAPKAASNKTMARRLIAALLGCDACEHAEGWAAWNMGASRGVNACGD